MTQVNTAIRDEQFLPGNANRLVNLSSVLRTSLGLSFITVTIVVAAAVFRLIPVESPVPLGWTTWARYPVIRFSLFLAAGSCLGYYIFLRRTIGVIEATMPPHFRATLNSLTQGLVVLDRKRVILVANDAFATVAGRPVNKIEKQQMDSLTWSFQESDPPWVRTIQDSSTQTGVTMRLVDVHQQERILRVNTAPLIDERGTTHGVLVSFDDVTQLEERNAELTSMLDKLRDSRDQVHRQNQELQVLATRDPLTFALNRRSFFDQLKNIWSASIRYENSLSCLMLDVDHFKNVNDTHGHAAGDAVLRDLACVLMKTTRNCDITCRYGGEEFCVIMPHQTMEQASKTAERIRQIIAETDFAGVRVTVSIGVSSIEHGANSPESLLDLADRALYRAKHDGRNRVICNDGLEPDRTHRDIQGGIRHPRRVVRDDSRSTPDAPPISFQTVSALINALAYRDAATAEHSRRVADLCVRLATDMMSMRECYILENAALLHDIGKIGVPDSILLKPGPLTEEEWVVMRSHDRIGREIVRSTFACEELAEIVEFHQVPFGQGTVGDGAPLPLGARILAIADSYDAMVTDRVYRRGRPEEEAMQELRRCAGRQFDPELVERFIGMQRKSEPSIPSDDTVIDKKVAIRLGIQIENLARALDDKDVHALVDLTSGILDTTATCQPNEISELAERLNLLASSTDAEWTDCLEVTLELLESCRKTQGIHLNPTS